MFSVLIDEIFDILFYDAQIKSEVYKMSKSYANSISRHQNDCTMCGGCSMVSV